MTSIMNAPQFVDQLPETQRAAFEPRKSELAQAAERFVRQLMDHRDKWAVAAKDVVSTSSLYEAFRTAGCEVRIVPQRKDGQFVTVKRANSKGVETEYKVNDVYVKLPPGEIKNRSGRQPWVAPAVRLEKLRDESKALAAERSARNTSGERRAEIDARQAEIGTLVEAIYERNPKLRPATA